MIIGQPQHSFVDNNNGELRVLHGRAGGVSNGDINAGLSTGHNVALRWLRSDGQRARQRRHRQQQRAGCISRTRRRTRDSNAVKTNPRALADHFDCRRNGRNVCLSDCDFNLCTAIGRGEPVGVPYSASVCEHKKALTADEGGLYQDLGGVARCVALAVWHQRQRLQFNDARRLR